MRKFWMLTVAALAAALCLPAAAQAQGARYTYPKTEVGNWKTYGIRTNCWISHQSAVDGTILSFSVSAGRPDFYFGFENRSWTQLENMKPYQVTMRFAGTESRVRATGVVDDKLGPMMAIFVADPSLDLFAALRSSQRASVTLDRTELFDLPLDPEAPVIDAFEDCARQFKAGPFSGT